MSTTSASAASNLWDLEEMTSAEPMPDPGTSIASPPASDSSSTNGQWLPTGRCSHCLELIETDQAAPSEQTTRHTESKVPYLECEPAQRMPVEIKRGADICPMRPVNTALIEKLDHYNIDPRDIKHWRHVRETTGGSHRVFDPIFPGEE